MKYAVIQTGAKQYKVQEGDELLIEKLSGKKGDKINFDQVLMLAIDKDKMVGRPAVDKAFVSAKILGQEKSKKLRVATYKAKSRYRRVKGHRQEKTRVLIEKIVKKKVKNSGK